MEPYTSDVNAIKRVQPQSAIEIICKLVMEVSLTRCQNDNLVSDFPFFPETARSVFDLHWTVDQFSFGAQNVCRYSLQFKRGIRYGRQFQR